ncbi:MAG: CocE/NonD family hydrolase, partial [Pseudomonadota bacterium]
DSYKYFAAYNGGVAKLASALGWMSRNGDIGMNDRSTNIPNKSQLLRQLPSIDLLRKAGLGPNYWDDFLKRSFTDPWWDKMGYTTDQDTFDTPAIHVDGWYDTGVSDTLRHFNRMRSHGMSVEARENQFAIISPGTHCRSEGLGKDAIVGDVNVSDASFPYWDTYLKWFDYWLKGKDNGVIKMPKIQYHVTQLQTWANAAQWPPAASVRVKYFLRSGGKANSLNGDGVLSQTPPAQEPSDRFVYDPGDPVPSKGGSFCCTGNPDDRPGIFDQTEIERRDDVLVYTSAALDKPMTLAGPLGGVLHVSSTARDTDFTLKLIDVQPDGKAYNIQESIIRTRYREGFDQQVFMKKGDVYRLAIDLNDTAYYLPAGHKLRLEVSSSNFPHFERNLNTGGRNYDETEWVKANNTVHHKNQYPSYITVSVKE